MEVLKTPVFVFKQILCVVREIHKVTKLGLCHYVASVCKTSAVRQRRRLFVMKVVTDRLFSPF